MDLARAKQFHALVYIGTVHLCVYFYITSIKTKIKINSIIASLDTWHMCMTVIGSVSLSLEEHSCSECVHTYSHMNEAERIELSCDSGSCQHGCVCDV